MTLLIEGCFSINSVLNHTEQALCGYSEAVRYCPDTQYARKTVAETVLETVPEIVPEIVPERLEYTTGMCLI